MTNAIQNRLQLLREQLPMWAVDAVLIDSPTNRRWLSGFTGSAGRLLITADNAILATDSRYWEQARNEAPDFELYQDKRRDEDIIALVESSTAQRIGIESHQITLTDANKLRSITSKKWVPLEKPVEPLRQKKTASEIDIIRAAAAVTDLAMAKVPQLLQVGMKEQELAWELEKTMRESGATGMAFPIIVAFGSNSALPHHHPGSRRLQDGEIVLVDMGAEINGYKSDLTRTFFFGDRPDDQFTTIYNLVLAALQAAANQIGPGVDSQSAHNFALDVISTGGYGDNFPHGLGHNVGLDIHEEPFLSSVRPAQEIEANMVITIEPGIYLPGWGGVRIEDLVLVTDTGIERLSNCPK